MAARGRSSDRRRSSSPTSGWTAHSWEGESLPGSDDLDLSHLGYRDSDCGIAPSLRKPCLHGAAYIFTKTVDLESKPRTGRDPMKNRARGRGDERETGQRLLDSLPRNV